MFFRSSPEANDRDDCLDPFLAVHVEVSPHQEKGVFHTKGCWNSNSPDPSHPHAVAEKTRENGAGVTTLSERVGFY
jgi:hypothetical protein